MTPWIEFNIWDVFRQCDWAKLEFQREKSYFLCALSKLSYASIPEVELVEIERAKLIPCFSYQESIRLGVTFNLEQVVREIDIPIVFEIQSRFIISVGFKLGEILFVSSRGTQDAYDWLVNIDARKWSGQTPCGTSFQVHRGFHRAASEMADKISEHVIDDQDRPKFKRVVFCGHSLGGAISANFFARCKICAKDNSIIPSYRWNCAMNAVASEAYVFGAPRFASYTSHDIFEPFSIVNHGDIVPTLPPNFMRYRDYRFLYDCSGHRLRRPHGDDFKSVVRWISSLFTMEGVQNHSIEQYISAHQKSL